MDNRQIKPEMITHPFQLMAAWFVMLLVLSSILLSAAYKINQPKWITPLLVIADIALCFVVMVAVFMMLTKFRPHLQGSKEYADWLKDERRFLGQRENVIEIGNFKFNENRELVVRGGFGKKHNSNNFDLATFKIETSYLEGAELLVNKLNENGFRARTYRNNRGSVERGKTEEHEAIWIGSRVPPIVAISVIKIAIEIWPFLKYLHLSNDSMNRPPDQIHDQIFLGGSTSTAIKYSLLPWEIGEIKEIQEIEDLNSFHNIIRSKYGV
jgi:hypothetical protein